MRLKNIRKKLAYLFYWLASRLDDRWPKYPDAVMHDMMIYGTGFAKRIEPEEIYSDMLKLPKN